MNGRGIENAVAYLHGRVSVQVETAAASLGISARELANRLGTLLLAEASGAVLGHLDNMPDVSGASTGRGKAPRQVAMARRSYRPTQKPKTGRSVNPKSSSSQKNAQREYWAKMTPEQRKKEMRRRMQVAAARRAEAA